MILANWDNKFYLGDDDSKWFISFDKYNQELFYLLSRENKQIFITTGPGSFIGTRSISAFALGYSFKKNISIYGFNFLFDILPHMDFLHRNDNMENIFYVYMELDRFFYYIEKKNIEKKEFYLKTKNEIDELCKNNMTCGNYIGCTYYYPLDYLKITKVMIDLKNKYKKKYFFKKIEYCGKFI